MYDVGKVIHHDFSKSVPSISALTTPFNSGKDEDPEIYANPQARYWKNKYLSLLEEFNEHLKKSAEDKPRK
jgi:hypothetical protein